MYIASLLKIIEYSLSIWESREKTRFQRELMDLKRQYFEESSKDEDDWNDDTLGHIEFELYLLLEQFSSLLPNPGERPKA